jgi:hypothetical protein
MSKTNLLENRRIENRRKKLATARLQEADRRVAARAAEQKLEQNVLGALIGMARRHGALQRSTVVIKALFMRLEKASPALLAELEAEGLAAIAVEDAAAEAEKVPVIIRFGRKLGGRASRVMEQQGMRYGVVSDQWEGLVAQDIALELAAANGGTVDFQLPPPREPEITQQAAE